MVELAFEPICGTLSSQNSNELKNKSGGYLKRERERERERTSFF
jgi:hypothetical protein